MTLQASSMADVVRDSTVSLWDGDEFLGSGFFIEPHLIVTCAHVVWDCADRVVVRWREHRFAGDVVVREPAARGDGAFYPHPDIAFVRATAAPDHPVARLAGDLTIPPELSAYGFSAATPDAGIARDTAGLEVVGRSGQFLRLKGDEIVDGMSGAPALDVRTGLVYGVIKGSRDYGGPRGGWIVQATDVALVRASHARVLGPRVEPAAPRLRPGRGSPLHDLLVAQCRAAERLPYRLVDGPAPPLSTVYVRQRAAPRYAAPGRDAPVRSVADVLRRHRHTLVVGGPGAGKSALVQHIVAETAAWWLDAASDAPAPYGPALALRVPAAAMLGRQPWLELLAGAVERDLSDYLDRGVDPDTLDPAAMPGVEWLLLVDGLDEVYDRDQRQRLIDVLGNRVAEYGSSWRFLVTTRPLFGQELAGLGAHLPDPSAGSRFGDYELRLFDRPGLRRFAQAWFTARTPLGWQRNATAYLDEIDVRRLDPLVRVPLLATIAAVVFEDRPQGPLPMSRTGLYERFVTNLVYARQRREELRRVLTDQLAVYGSGGGRLVDVLFDRTEQLLEDVAHHRLEADERIATTALAEDWLRRQEVPAQPVPELSRHLRTMLLGTGLLTVAGDDLRFIHRGFAEYLAAGYSVRTDWNTRHWLHRVRRDGITNLDMFRLIRWADAGNDAEPVLRRLLRARPVVRPPFVRRPNLLEFCAVLRDGLPLPERSAARLVAAGFAAVRRLRVVDEAALPALTYALRSLHARSSGSAHLVRLARDGRAAPVKRIAAARALILTGTDDDHRAAVEALDALLASSSPDDAGGLWAAYTIASVADAGARQRATDHLTWAVATARDPESRVRAAVFLTELGHGSTVDQQLLVQAVSPARTPAQRFESIEALRLVGPAGRGAPVTERIADVRQHLRATALAHLTAPERAGAPADLEALDVGDLTGLADGAARLAGHDPAATGRILAAALAEGGITDGAGAYLAETLRGNGHDTAADMINKVGASLSPAEPDPSAPELAARAADRSALGHERLEAAGQLRRDEPEAAIWLEIAWHADPVVPVLLKIEEALDLARRHGRYDLAFAMLRAYANQHARRRQRLAAWLGAVALELDELTYRINDQPTGPAPLRDDSAAERGRQAALRRWLDRGGGTEEALARAAETATSAGVSAAITGALSPVDDPAPRAGGDLAAARGAMRARAETLRIVVPAGQANPNWTERDLVASIGEAVAAKADAVLVEVLADPRAAAREEQRLARANAARACPWYARLVREVYQHEGHERAARLALAVALREVADRYPSRRRIRLPSQQVLHSVSIGLRRTLWSLGLAMAAVYAATFVGAAVPLLGDPGVLTAAGVARIAEVQAQIALPAVVVMGCLLLRPARLSTAVRRARLAVWTAGALAAYLSQVDGRGLRLPPWPAVEDVLRGTGELLVGLLPAASQPALVLAATGLATAIATAHLPFRIPAARRHASLRSAAKTAALAAIAWWSLALTIGDLRAAADTILSAIAATGLP
ncbi:trypsin-like peptidase domain-containing protein [Micromonospora sp. CPCC 206061]|uniref:trypsin-like peptidase domain-containing protein n=1 Tax=Micromonospora sp. CPCC 206061 TaxID=3122410 RepID=UPI002FF26CDA